VAGLFLFYLFLSTQITFIALTINNSFFYNCQLYKTMRKHYKLILLPIIAALVFTMANCKKEKPEVPPTLTTLDVNNITWVSALSGGEITNDGGGEIFSRGVVWSKMPNPTLELNNGTTIEGSGPGLFQSNILGLQPNTTYHVRAYATNSSGNGYGQQESFVTNDIGEPGDGVTDIDGNFYPSVIIGNQEWMAENLKTTHYRNGSPIEFPGTNNTAWMNNTTGAYSWYGYEHIGWKDLYGGLYNWYAVNNSNGLCPNGWHVPSDAEWTELTDYVVAQGFPNSDVLNGTGNALKSCQQESSPFGGFCAPSMHPRWDSDTTHYGTDEFGFSALPGGTRYTQGFYWGIGNSGFWWSSTEDDATMASRQVIGFNFGNVAQYNFFKGHGLSVRCVRNMD